MTAIRTAILGYGRNGSTMHAGPVEQNDAFQMAAVCDIDPERRQQAAERFACPVYDDHRRMLEAEKLDFVVIVTRSHQHCEMTCDCLEAGVDVLVTKPWAINAAEACRMVDAAGRSGHRLFPWLPARWGTDLRRLRELVAGEVIGNVFLIRRAVTTFATRCDWQTERQYGGGYLLNWGAHIVEPPVLLAGSPVATVYARMKQTINPGDVEDVFLAVMTLENGTVVQAEFTVAVPELPSWFIQGDRGTIVVRGQDLTIHKNTPARPGDPTRYRDMTSDDEQVIQERLGDAVYGDEYEIYGEIARALRGEAGYPVTPNDALELTRLLDAIRTSSTEGRVVLHRSLGAGQQERLPQVGPRPVGDLGPE